jgi:arylsulfatase A-like enzyme
MLSMVFPLVALASLSAVSPLQPPTDRPNILMIIADDWSWPHASAYGDPAVRTPNFDAMAARGVLYRNAYCSAPTCSASRAGLLTGKYPHRLGPGANLWGVLPTQYATYPDLLAWAGYVAGHTGKGWGPGVIAGSGRTHNPAGPPSKSFDDFLKKVPAGHPFCFWYGSLDPHRPYEKGTGAKAGLDPAKVKVHASLPDRPEVRDDILDYYFEVQRFDTMIGELLKTLDASGRADNTIVIVTSDNGMPFPRAKANLYDAGTHVPLAIRWPKGIKKPQSVDDLVCHVDVTATILEAAGVRSDGTIDGQSLVRYFNGEKIDSPRDIVLVERERHADVRRGSLGYPSRAIRTKKHLYVRNFDPTLWPAGDPMKWKAVGPYGDIDPSPTKDIITQGAQDPSLKLFRALAIEPRPLEELYAWTLDDRGETQNLVKDPDHADTLQIHRKIMNDLLAATDDPRSSDRAEFDSYPYVSGKDERRPQGEGVEDNTLTELESKLGWQLLFDGRTLNGWTTEKRQPSKTPVDQGAINPHKAGGYMMIHHTPVGDFVLSLDFQITPKCNSGVFIRTEPLTPRPGKDIGFNGIEIAIDDTTSSGFHDTGAVYDLVKPTKNAMKPVGQWNHMVIVADGPKLEVEINGQLVTRMNFDEWTLPNKRPDGTDHKFDIAYKNHPRVGYLGLQDHGSPCRYKNIKLLKIR